MSNAYKGFDTTGYLAGTTNSFDLYNVDLVKQDLLNHIYTEKGDRIHMPNFGTRIQSLMMEPLDQDTIDVIKEDLTAVVNFDPRVSLLNLNIYPFMDNNAVVCVMTLLYIEFNVTNDLNLNFTFGTL